MIPLSKLWINHLELQEIKNVLDSRWLAKGSKNRELEELVSDYLGVEHVVCMSSCTAALHCALFSLNLSHGEVAVSDFTFPASGHAVTHAGMEPVFVDISLDDYNMDHISLAASITNKTEAIMVVHAFGHSADMGNIIEVADGIPIIEDAACAIGSKYDGEFCGTIGEVGCFSLHATKSVGVGEGGFLVTDNDDVADFAREFINFGRDGNLFKFPGFNFKMSDLTASVGIAQFKKLDDIIERKNYLAKYYERCLNGIKCVTPPIVKENCLHNFQSYTCMTSTNVDRDELIAFLRKMDIEASIGTYSSFCQPAYNVEESYWCPNSFYAYTRCIRLPMFYELTEKEIDYIADALEIYDEEIKDSAASQTTSPA
jgi:perosamine synthetase